MLVEHERRGGGRQRDYNQLFHDNLVTATYQFISSVFDFVNYWAGEELSLDNVEDGDYKSAVLEMEREATVVLFSTYDDTCYIAVKSDWFTKYISCNMGIVQDCYIAKISTDWKEIVKLSKELPLPDVEDTIANKTNFEEDHDEHGTGTDISALAPLTVPPIQPKN